jgi:hypothetical protein
VTALDDAIEAAGGQFQTRVTITWPGGGTNPIFNLVADVTVDRAVQDQPMAVTQIAGAAAAQAQVTLKSGDGTYLASMLSPFSTNAWSTRGIAGYGVGQVGIVIDEGVMVSGAYVYTTLFTGTVTGFTLGDDGSAQLTCVDRSVTIQGSANLPAAGGIAKSIAGDTRLNPLAVVDLALRSGGYYLTRGQWGPSFYNLPAPTLSVPGIGASLPEVGSFVTGPSTSLNVASPWPTQLPTVDVQQSTSITNCSIFRCTTAFSAAAGHYVLMEGWFYLTRPGTTTGVIVLGDEVDAQEVQVYVNSTGTVSLRIGLGAAIWTSTGTIPTGPSWVHLFLILSEATGYLSINESSWETVSTSTTSLTGLSQVRLACPVLGLQVTNDSFAFTAMGAAPPGWTPNYTATLDTVPQRLSGVVRQTGPAWALVQQVAQALGDVAYWDGAGAFHYESRTTWAARRGVAPTYIKSDGRILSGAPAWNQDSLRRSVSANIVVPSTLQSTVAKPAFVATEIYTVPARSRLTFDIALDYAVYDIKTAANAWSTDASSSWFRATAADSVNDPAAALVGSISVGFRATATGITLTVVNNNAFDISLWSPGDGGPIAAGPYLIVHGKTITFPEPRAITAQASTLSSADDLVLEDNPWRQDQTQTQAWVSSVASDVAMPQMVWPSVSIPVDPRLQLGTCITLADVTYMDVTHPVQIVGIAYNLPAEEMHRMELTVRSVYSPTGPLIGVTGRMEIGPSLVLVG